MAQRYTKQQVQEAAGNIRKRILKLAVERGGCYLGQACSSAELFATLYMRVLRLGESLGSMEAQPFPGVPSPNNMDYPKGSLYHGASAPGYDRLFVSPAHYASVVYCALIECGRLSPEAIEKFNVDGWNMEMIGAEHSPGFETTAGSLGQTISVAAGVAHARKLKGEEGDVYVMLSDGELQEGQFFEALALSSFYKLDNLKLVIDENGQQVEGYTKDVMDMEPLEDKLSAFGCCVKTVDGHNIDAIESALAQKTPGSPLAVICKTSAAKGVPLLEKRVPMLHFVRFSGDELVQAKEFLETL